MSIGSELEIQKLYFIESGLIHQKPDGSKNIVRPNDEQNILITELNIPGIHLILNGNDIIAQWAANISHEELISRRLDNAELSLLLPEKSLIIPLESDLPVKIRQARIGIELWHNILYLLLVLLIFEMLLSNVSRKK